MNRQLSLILLLIYRTGRLMVRMSPDGGRVVIVVIVPAEPALSAGPVMLHTAPEVYNAHGYVPEVQSKE